MPPELNMLAAKLAALEAKVEGLEAKNEELESASLVLACGRTCVYRDSS